MPAECAEQRCLQDGEPCDYAPHGYTYCRPHGEHHRPPECPVDEAGNPKPWWEETYELPTARLEEFIPRIIAPPPGSSVFINSVVD